jgi:hypothetical protein
VNALLGSETGRIVTGGGSPADQDAARIAQIVTVMHAVLAEQQDLVHRLGALEGFTDAPTKRERRAIRAHMARHEAAMRRLLAELDALTGRAT